MQPENGDYVIIKIKDEEFEGILIPRPDIFKKGHLILKLATGYNIGIDEKKITKIEVIKKHEQKIPEKFEPKSAKGLPAVSILSFGGTISSKVDYRTGGTYADYTAEDFIKMMPELEKVANLRAEKVMGIMSEDMSPEDWGTMAQRIANELNKDEVHGVVVTQGTDTLHFSTAAMSFFLRNLNKPVVFTAAQRSIDRGSSDAYFNLLCSVQAAARFDGAAVVTCMHGTSSDNFCILNRGTKVRKMHTSRRDAFRPINEMPLAKVHGDGKIEILNHSYEKRSHRKVIVENSFEEKTGLLYVHPGMNPEILDFFSEKKYKGIVIAGTALGHVPTVNPKYSLYGKIKKLVDEKTIVVIATQTIYGRVHPFVYSNLRKLSIELGCIYAEDILPETAFVKLGWILGQTSNKDEVAKMMLTNYANEMNDRHDEESFLY